MKTIKLDKLISIVRLIGSSDDDQPFSILVHDEGEYFWYDESLRLDHLVRSALSGYEDGPIYNLRARILIEIEDAPGELDDE